MTEPLEVIITSGGTISKIDDVRHIGNFSEGTTGALIAEEFLKKGAKVHYVYGKKAKRPFRQYMAVDPSKPLHEENVRLKGVYDDFQKYAGLLYEHPIETFEEYHDKLKELLTGGKPDVVVLAAAVSDYSAKKQEGKISSDLDEMKISLEKNPKIISLVKQWNPEVFQVGFKLLSGAEPKELIDVAYKHGIKNHSDLTIANSISGGDFGKRTSFIITPEKGITPVSVSNLAENLVDSVYQRVSKNHYSTRLEKDADWVGKYGLEKEISSFKENILKFWKLNAFHNYYEGSSAQFGFLAMRLPQGFLITGRGSNKEKPSLNDIVYVRQADLDKRVIYATSSGSKASLNANVAARIFSERPDTDIILHSHIHPGLLAKADIDYAPGTKEDENNVMDFLSKGNSVELPRHGVIIAGKNLAQIVSSLEIDPSYTRFPEFYDIIYARFQQSDEFMNLVKSNVRKEESVLDLAAGTGIFTCQLLDQGYTDVSMADKNREMIYTAKVKTPCDVNDTYVADFTDNNWSTKYDAIVLRQAINYAMDYSGLVKAFKNMRSHLNEGGSLVFNAPNFKPESKFSDRVHEYIAGGYDVRIDEKNLVEGKTLVHTQQCYLTRKDGSEFKSLYDINRFGLFTKEEFEQALRESGFGKISFFGKELKEYSPDSKSIYCVAER
jgi:phosphopantothenate---cysteine ligase (CTP)